jgi:hypothetical protein
MRSIGRVVIACAAGAALMAAAPAALAAQKVHLHRIESGNPLLAGEGAIHYLFIEASLGAAYCERIETGTVVSADKPTDKFALGTVTSQSCSSEASLGGVSKEVKISAKGLAWTVKAPSKLVFRLPGPCVYDLSMLAGTFEPGAGAEAGVATTAKLYKKSSSIHCPAGETFEGESRLYAKEPEGAEALHIELL